MDERPRSASANILSDSPGRRATPLFESLKPFELDNTAFQMNGIASVDIDQVEGFPMISSGSSGTMPNFYTFPTLLPPSLRQPVAQSLDDENQAVNTAPVIESSINVVPSEASAGSSREPKRELVQSVSFQSTLPDGRTREQVISNATKESAVRVSIPLSTYCLAHFAFQTPRSPVRSASSVQPLKGSLKMGNRAAQARVGFAERRTVSFNIPQEESRAEVLPVKWTDYGSSIASPPKPKKPVGTSSLFHLSI